MNMLDMTNTFEKHICDKADQRNIPIGATFELLPACNMDCKMCYVKMSYQEMMDKGGYLSKEQWFSILESAQKAGLLFLLLTGGEPLLHPDFKDIYLKAKELGMVVCVNTNGTLIDEKMADFFAENKPRRLNITMYGSSNETYENLCSNPRGFEQFDRAITLLQERQVEIKLNCSLTPQNYQDLDSMIAYAKEKDLMIEVASYMFPPYRKNKKDININNRLTLQQQVDARIRYEQLFYSKKDFDTKAKAIIYCIDNDVELPQKPPNVGFSCRSGSSTYWINWKGDMIPCGMFTSPRISVFNRSIEEAFQYIVKEVSQLKRADKCYKCKKEYICQVCMAAAVCETGRFDGVSKHHCDACDLYIEQLREYVKNNGGLDIHENR